MLDGYELAVIGAQRETGFGDEVLPGVCSWTFEEIMAADF